MSATPDSTLADCQQLVADLQRQLAECRAERDEAVEYQTATSDVLKVIARSTFDLQPILDTLVETGQRLCDADMAGLTIREGEVFRYVATRPRNPAYDAFLHAEDRQDFVLLGGRQTHGHASDPEIAIALQHLKILRRAAHRPLGETDPTSQT